MYISWPASTGAYMGSLSHFSGAGFFLWSRQESQRVQRAGAWWATVVLSHPEDMEWREEWESLSWVWGILWDAAPLLPQPSGDHCTIGLAYWRYWNAFQGLCGHSVVWGHPFLVSNFSVLCLHLHSWPAWRGAGPRSASWIPAPSQRNFLLSVVGCPQVWNSLDAKQRENAKAQ